MPNPQLQHSRVPLATRGTEPLYITPEWYRSLQDLVRLANEQQARIVALEAAVTTLGGDVDAVEEGGFLLLE